MTVLAVVIFATTAGPIGTSAARQWFPDQAACTRFLTDSAAMLEGQRARLETATGAPVSMLALCHDVGRGA